MEEVLQKFKDLKIQLAEITSATDNFNDEKNYIGGGGFGKVYKGQVSHSKGRSMVAIKRLDRNKDQDQGDREFLKEITTLSHYKHVNLICLLGFCYQGGEAILVYELASRGSLDQHLGSQDLTWSQRLNICLGAAKGLRHLHDPKGTHQRLIHCDVKSGNILLDDHWNAKIADFGFSTMGPANDLYSTVITLAAGTLGYCDPKYLMTNTLTKESDVYSFGVVLFEVLCGTLCYRHSNGRVQQILVRRWKECYEEKKLDDIIFKDPAIQPLKHSVLEIFSDIAYQCLKDSRELRPKMADVVTELERALNIHELLQNAEFKAKWDTQSFYYKKIAESAEPPLKYTSEEELKNLLTKGVLLNRGKTWFSLSKKGEHCEMISIAECLGSKFKSGSMGYNSRFPFGTCFSCDGIFNTRVKTQFLSPGITYTVNLVFKFFNKKEPRRICERISLKYKLQGETKSLVSHLAYEREDGWWMAELYQFTCDHNIVHLPILFDGFCFYTSIEAEGIEFQPLENVEHKEDENQSISDSNSDANWEENLPTDYEDIIKLSISSLQWTTKEEAYSIMRKGFLMNNDDKMEKSIWFSLDKNLKKCLMLSATKVVKQSIGKILPIPESRFGEAYECQYYGFYLMYEVQWQLVSFETTYAIYLVYKLSKHQSGFEAPMRVMDQEYLGPGDNKSWYIYFISPQTPVIKPKAGKNTHNPANKMIKESLPQQRNDGWMEVRLLECRSDMTKEMIPTLLELTTTGDYKKKFWGLIIEGIEIRPT